MTRKLVPLAALVLAGCATRPASPPDFFTALSALCGKAYEGRIASPATPADASFAGKRLVQVTLHPTVIVRQAQLNLLTPSGGGTRLLRAIQAASQRLGAP